VKIFFRESECYGGGKVPLAPPFLCGFYESAADVRISISKFIVTIEIERARISSIVIITATKHFHVRPGTHMR